MKENKKPGKDYQETGKRKDCKNEMLYNIG